MCICIKPREYKLGLYEKEDYRYFLLKKPYNFLIARHGPSRVSLRKKYRTKRTPYRIPDRAVKYRTVRCKYRTLATLVEGPGGPMHYQIMRKVPVQCMKHLQLLSHSYAVKPRETTPDSMISGFYELLSWSPEVHYIEFLLYMGPRSPANWRTTTIFASPKMGGRTEEHCITNDRYRYW